MDREQIFLFAGITTCALAVAAYVIWGPPTVKRRKGPIVGLRNLGMTCFLNTVLQSLASCSFFVEWSVSLPRKGNVSQTIEKILHILNGEVPSADIPYSPTDIIAAIRNHGWAMPHSEHDAHEFFHVVLSSIEEEITESNPATKSSLLDVLDKESKNIIEEKEAEEKMVEEKRIEEKKVDEKDVDEESPQDQGDASSKIINRDTGDLVIRRNLISAKHLANINKLSLNIIDKSKTSPFKGFLTSQIKCSHCGFKSALRYDAFDSISLHLPPTASLLTNYSLTGLLDTFVKTGQIEGVECDGCNKNRESSEPIQKWPASQTLRFGKLPKCLCFHIPRMILQTDGTLYKRQDSIEFSEYLSMDPYAHYSLSKNKVNSDKTLKLSNGIANGVVRSDEMSSTNSRLYRLKAVIVHYGNGESGGHFVTYRHGYLRSQTRHRWYLTSDEEVRQVTLCEVLSSLPYMLFYEKCESFTNNDSAVR